MTKSTPNKPRWRIVYTFTPLLLLISCLMSINLLNWWLHPAPMQDVGLETAVSTQPIPQATPTQSNTAPSTPATLTPSPSATPYIPPTFPADTQIQLLGPPENSTFSKEKPLSLYWKWSLPLEDDQYFAVSLRIEGEQIELDPIYEPNSGLNYRWQLNPDSISASTEIIEWQIILRSSNSNTPLITSHTRSFSYR